jgi:hypothetical protein
MTFAVDLAQAKAALEIETSDRDAVLADRLEAAVGLVLKYCKTDAETAGDLDDGDQARLRTASILVFGNLTAHRGDDENSEGPLTRAVRDLLHDLRDPTLA